MIQANISLLYAYHLIRRLIKLEMLDRLLPIDFLSLFFLVFVIDKSFVYVQSLTFVIIDVSITRKTLVYRLSVGYQNLTLSSVQSIGMPFAIKQTIYFCISTKRFGFLHVYLFLHLKVHLRESNEPCQYQWHRGRPFKSCLLLLLLFQCAFIV